MAVNNPTDILRDVLENDEISAETRLKLENLQTAYIEHERQQTEMSANYEELKKRYYDRFFSGNPGEAEPISNTPSEAEPEKHIDDLIYA